MPELYPPMSERELRNAALARRAAAQGMVLLKNDNAALPLHKGTLALFGSGAVRTVRGGTGSGDPFNGGISGGGKANVDQSPRYHIYVLDAFLADGWNIPTQADLLEYAKAYDAERTGAAVNPMATFAFPDQKISAEDAAKYAALSDTAVYVISRNAGEGADRKMMVSEERDIGDYELSGIEKENLQNLRAAFRKLVLVLNAGGVVDLSYPLAVGVDAILVMGQAGQEGGAALVDVLSGAVNPSGKLTDTWAARYSDYPASATFALNDGNSLIERYTEGIYVGYRYFDAFGIEPLFPFGFGLSYTTFSVTPAGAELAGETLTVKALVKNTGGTAGREVVQVYRSAPDGSLEMPVQELCGFAKTKLLAPGESETVAISMNVRDFASYDVNREGYVLQAGDTRFLVGNSSRCTAPACVLRVPADTMTKYVATVLLLKDPLDEITRRGANSYALPGGWEKVPVFPLGALAAEPKPNYTERITTYTTDPDYQPVMPYEDVELVTRTGVTWDDVMAGRATWEELAAQIDDADLATLNCGTGWGVADENNPIVGANSKTVRGAAGETTPDLRDRFGIPTLIMADGPGGVRVTQEYEARSVETGEMVPIYQYATAWPVGTPLAQSFDPDLLYEVGVGFSEEMAEIGVHILLGPGMNIHRDPLCGRNFEYFSEDPLVTGKCAAAIVKGVQSRPGACACIKHFATNNQETDRNSTDSQVGPRALREIYLRGFEIAVRESHPLSIMTSYNHTCNVPSGDSYELCTLLARDEWGFDGLIMTDWNGGCSTPWKSMHGGNDLIMPGGKLRAENILLALHPSGPVFDERGQVASFTTPPFPVPNLLWKSFTLDGEGPDTVAAPLGEGHTAEVSADGTILVDGEPLYTATLGIRELMRLMREHRGEQDHLGMPKQLPNLLTAPLTTAAASLSDDGRAILYRGRLRRGSLLCRGDLQRCAIHNMKVIAEAQKLKK